LFGEECAEKPNGKQDRCGAQRTEDVPVGGVRVSESNGDAGDERNGKQDSPSGSVTKDAQERISGVIDFLAEQAPQRRLPKNGMLAPEMEFFAVQAIDEESADDGYENAGVTAKVETCDGKFCFRAKREMDAEAGNEEENDDSGGAKDDAAPGMSEKAAESRGLVGTGEQRKHAVMANGHPQSKDETQGVENRVAVSLADDGGGQWARSDFCAETK